jgi:hypothetical protein
MVVKQLERLVPMLGSSNEAGQAALKALNMLAKHVPAGSVTPASERNMAEQTQMKAIQNNQMMQAMKQGGQAGGGAPQAPGMAA